MTENEIGKIVVDECIQLHRALGPGLLEIVYEVTLARRLAKKGLKVARQVSVPIEFEGEQFDEGFRADLMNNLGSCGHVAFGSVVPWCLCERQSEPVGAGQGR